MGPSVVGRVWSREESGKIRRRLGRQALEDSLGKMKFSS